uniref:Uncharacterized protein n=1 Tax=Aureoumbra lagunensis TaxID=44058 RepID=A0A7S3NKU5_9STRA|mmetsp:Transcript_23460/g.30473  ORF Transcript_23460/g.30473 Transcript_23460/m.30473 type:complete len:325 (+) Transcript_23460:47-1021(+)
MEEEDVEVKSKVSSEMRSRLIRALAPQHKESEVDALRATVLEIFVNQHKAKPREFIVPPQVVSKYVCGRCGNRNQANFTHDQKGGDVICLGADGEGCGAIVEEHHMFEGNQHRKFEGEEDKSHHGPAPNRLFSASHNMRTNLVAVAGAGASRAARLRLCADQVELGLSNLGRKDERRTREGYKDAQKKRAFELISHVAMNLNIHQTVVERANELFAYYRDNKEILHRFNAVVAACLLQALEENMQTISANQKSNQNSTQEAPLFISRRRAILERPVAAAASKRPHDNDSHKSATKKIKPNTLRVGKAWALALQEDDFLSSDGDD